MTLYDLEALLHVIIAILGYGAIGIYIAPRFSADGSPKWVFAMQCSAVMFFIGCALHHLTMAYHTMADPQPWMISPDHILIQAAQAIGAPLFLISTTYLGQIRIDKFTRTDNYITRISWPTKLIATLVVGIFAGGIVWNIYILRTEVSPFTWNDGPTFVQSPVTKGNPLLVTVNRCNNTNHDIHFISTRILVNEQTGKRTPLAPGGVNMKPGCEVIKDIPLDIIPDDLEPGIYVLQSTIDAQGDVRKFYIYQTTTPFEVLPNDHE